MPGASSCGCGCTTPVQVAVPGAPGQDFSNLPPDTMDPNGVKVATVAGQQYFNTTDSSLWIALAVGNSSWTQLIGP